MVHRFSRGLYFPCKSNSKEIVPKESYKNDDFLILIILIILLAASPSLGLNSSYFFIIIMTIIGLGGVGNDFRINI